MSLFGGAGRRGAVAADLWPEYAAPAYAAFAGLQRLVERAPDAEAFHAASTSDRCQIVMRLGY
ncbi:hypothetical protein PF005_g11091 [Phytophthora fragariae]|uniref:Uncharacterized protein n=1 Tax=Phytophthora fragariae TaxID=53985 RepID=A0A6A3Z958_9STRA|nr:hypothetical protein PF003_g23046 [Phytophthora fragariae]KAE8937595.1 hypothetical protein PF009_g12510 [Phytophthora fragariae]KAE9009231.1 hypothetical protein PF011_g10376 [Phytophthora fragariae]KAE9110329.1 hypothetical protein PF007_g11899 [Phytophthora fragariae]KAE9115250.1 hypothetical protein PF010_g9400 [Phytophthora fragariae]